MSTRAVLAAALAGVALVASADDPEVVAQAGDTVWYAADVDDYAQDTYVNQCDQDLARLAPGAEVIIGTIVPTVTCTYRIPYADGLLQAFQDHAEARASEPPSRRRSNREIWDALLPRYAAKAQCAKGFRSETKVGVAYIECVKVYSTKESCPKGGAIRVAPGRIVPFTERPEERKCSRDTGACPAGTTAVPKKALSGIAGCYRCPAGELDLTETLAWRKNDIQGRRVLCKAKRPAPAASPAAAAGTSGP